MFNAFFFDLDGTLLDTEILWVEATERYVRDCGLDARHEDVLADVYGISWRGVRENMQWRFPELTWDWDAIKRHFLRLREIRPLPIEGSINLLRRLARNYPVAVVSGSTREDVQDGLARIGIEDCVAFALDDSSYSPGKPDPACYRMAAERVGLSPASCVAFEDSTAGIAAAKGAGLYCAALVRPGRPAQDVSMADIVLEDLSRFPLDGIREPSPARTPCSCPSRS